MKERSCERGREGGNEGGAEGGRDGGREGGREGRREGGKEGGREGGRIRQLARERGGQRNQQRPEGAGEESQEQGGGAKGSKGAAGTTRHPNSGLAQQLCSTTQPHCGSHSAQCRSASVTHGVSAAALVESSFNPMLLRRRSILRRLQTSLLQAAVWDGHMPLFEFQPIRSDQMRPDPI